MVSNNPLFLISNDDGVHAPGIRALAKVAARFGEVIVVAPHVERSASSHAITIGSPLRVEEIEDNVFAVEGTPADCIMLACRRILSRKPTWVLSGINRGANLGIDTLYSGTVGAAMEGSILGFPAMAISSLGKPRDRIHYETAAEISFRLLENKGLVEDIARLGVININVPNLPLADIRGVRIATLGRRLYSDEMIQGIDPRGRPYYWIGGGGDGFEDIPNSDCDLTKQGYATVSFLKTSFWDEGINKTLQTRLEKVFGS